MNPLKRGLEAVKAVKRNKKLFVVLVLVQILFIVSVSFIGVKYQVKIYENVKGIIEPLEGMDYTGMEDLTSEGMNDPMVKELLKEMVSITKNYKEMVENIFTMVFLLLGCFLILNGFIWSLADYMIKRGKWLLYWGKFVLVSLMFLVPVSLVSYFILRNFIGMDLELFKLGLKIVGGILLVMSYFLIIGFCLLEEKIGGLLKKIFLIGAKKAHWVLLSLLCCLFFVSLGLAVIYFSRENPLLIAFGGLVLVVALVLGKLFLVGVVKGVKEV